MLDISDDSDTTSDFKPLARGPPQLASTVSQQQIPRAPQLKQSTTAVLDISDDSSSVSAPPDRLQLASPSKGKALLITPVQSFVVASKGQTTTSSSSQPQNQ